jgi:type IV pilus assembly protein PilE
MMRTQVTRPATGGCTRRSSGGFSLIELMITVGIAAILATIAAAAYTSEVRKSRRTDARTAILDLAGREEKLFSVSNAYSQTPSDLGYGAVGVLFPVTVGSGYYQVSIVSPDPAQGLAPATYSITATPINQQLSDTDCASISINQLGAQTALTSGGVANAATCWGN